MTSEHEEIRRRLAGVPSATPPPDLADKIKAAIPADLGRGTQRRDDGSRASWWRMAASVLMLFGFTYVAVRTYLESRAFESARVAAPPRVVVQAPVATAVSSTSVAGADRELKQELRHDELLAASEPAAPPVAMTRVEQAKPEKRATPPGRFRARDEVAASAPEAPAAEFAPEPESQAAFKEEDAVAESETVAAAAAPPPPPRAVVSAPAPAARDAAEGAAAPRAQRREAKSLTGSSGQTMPAVVERVDPVIPEAFRKRDIRGTILVHVAIEPSGSVIRLRLIRGVQKEIDAAYVDAIRRWRFEAAAKGAPAVREAVLRIDYPEQATEH